jgi:general secretion pathway protein H
LKSSKGFTLVELLVVLLVLSLVAGVAVFSMGVFKSSHNLENTTQGLSSRLRLAQMEALFEQQALGIAVDERGYKFYRKNTAEGDWELISDDSLFKAQAFPNHTQLQLTVNGKVQSLSQDEPQLVLLQGELVPFSISFQDNNNHLYEISLNSEGEIVWTPQ